MQGEGKYPVVRQTFTTPNKLLPSSSSLRARIDQILFKTGPSQIKNRQKHATKLAEGITKSLIFQKKRTNLFQKVQLQIS